MQYMLLWANFRRFYLYVMTENMKRVLIAHRQCVLHEEVKNRFQLCERTILSAATLPEFDEAYTRQDYNFFHSTIIHYTSIRFYPVQGNSKRSPINSLLNRENVIQVPEYPYGIPVFSSNES